MSKVGIFFCFVYLFCELTQASEFTKVRIGWQVPWTIQGQIVQILKHTDILAKHGLEAEFIGKTFGPELNVLALTGKVDVLLTADQPAAVLFSKSVDWIGVGRLMYNRTSTYVPVQSSILVIPDLVGKTVGVPRGAAAERVLMNALEESSVASASVSIVNLDMLAHSPLILSSNPMDQKWGQFDALSGFDPIPAILESQSRLRTIHEGKVCALVVSNKTFTLENKNAMRSLLTSVGEAYKYYRKNRAQVNQWFQEEAKLPELTAEAASITEKFEPNLKPGAVRLSFIESDFELMQQGADFVKQATGDRIEMIKFVSNDLVPEEFR